MQASSSEKAPWDAAMGSSYIPSFFVHVCVFNVCVADEYVRIHVRCMWRADGRGGRFP